LSAVTTLGDDHTLSSLDQVCDELTGSEVSDQCADREFDDDVFAVLAGHIVAATLCSLLGTQVSHVSEIGECVCVMRGYEDDISSLAAISACRSSTGHVFFASERNCAISSVSSRDFNCGFIDKHGMPRGWAETQNASRVEALEGE
jgi:hypothetical protein